MRQKHSGPSSVINPIGILLLCIYFKEWTWSKIADSIGDIAKEPKLVFVSVTFKAGNSHYGESFYYMVPNRWRTLKVSCIWKNTVTKLTLLLSDHFSDYKVIFMKQEVVPRLS